MKFRSLMPAVVAAAMAFPLRAAPPRTIAVQGVLQNAAAPFGPKPDGPYGVVLRLYDAASGGSLLYTEPAAANTSKTVTVSGGRGVFATSLGDVTAFPATLLFDKPYFLSVQVVGDAEMTPRIALQSVPYALGSASLALPLSQTASSSGNLVLFTNSGSGNALYGKAAGATGFNVGVVGESASTDGWGVYGTNGSDTGLTYGVVGQDYSNGGVGMYGAARASASVGGGFPIGVWAVNLASGGSALRADAAATTGDVTGVFATVASPAGTGILGQHNASGTEAGVEGDTSSTSSSAVGVLGKVTSTAPGGFSAGVRGVNSGTGGNGIGVYGTQAGGGYGVYGTAPSGYGAYGGSTSGVGVYGSSSSYVGVYGFSGSNAGLYGVCDTSVAVRGDSLSGYGLIGTTKTGNMLAGGAIATTGGPITYKFRVDSGGKVFANGGYQTGGADVAEFVPSTGDPQPGDVVEIDPDNAGRFRLAAALNSTAVAGVISTLPGVSMGAYKPAEAETTGPQLALVGRVPVKATCENGPIRLGDLLSASSTPGRAMRAPRHPEPGTIIGKAISPLERGQGTVEMLVMLR